MPNMTPSDPEIVLYGGAFDPPHTGHAGCLQLVLAALPKAQVYVIPSHSPPGVPGAPKNAPSASFADRVAMCGLAFAGLSERIHVETWEQDLPAPNFTIQTLEKVATLFPGRSLGLLVGQDQLEAFPIWKNPRAILEMATLLVAARHSPPDAPAAADSNDDRVANAERLSIELQSAIRLAATQLQMPDFASRIRTLNGVLSPAASREIRSQFQHGKTPPKQWLSSAVFSYITAHRLYQPET